MTLRRHMELHRDRWIFAVVGELGGIHFWCIPSREVDGKPGCGGVEQHSLKPMHESPKPHSNENCWLLGKPCYHDGSSLYAEEYYIPLFNVCNASGNFESLWISLESEYRKRFEIEE